LADTREDLAASVNHALSQSGLPVLPLDRVMSRVGNGARTLIRGCLEDAGVATPPSTEASKLEEGILSDFLLHYGEHCLQRTTAYPGVASSLGRLGSYRKAVLTNKPTAPALRILEGLGLAPHFELILGGDNPHGKKPDPAALSFIMSSLGSTPESTVMIGDGVQDARVARAAGTSLIGFLNGIAPRAALLAEAPDAAVESMESLPETIAVLESRLSARPRSGYVESRP
jgi:phosphoglycolate phosphatase